MSGDQDAAFATFENFGLAPVAEGQDAGSIYAFENFGLAPQTNSRDAAGHYTFENFGAVYPAFTLVDRRPPAWGVTPISAGITPVYSGASDANFETYENFVPAGQPPVTSGLIGYFGAEYQKATYADNGYITSLRDQSGQNNHGTGYSGAADGTPKIKYAGGYGGAAYMDVNATGWGWTLADSMYTGLTAIEMFMTVRSKGDCRAPYNQNGGANDQYYPLSDGKIYSNFHRTDRPQITPPFALSNWHRMSIWSTSAGGSDSWHMRFNNTDHASGSSTFDIGTAGGRWLGTRTNVGNPAGVELGCVLFYNRRLTVSERSTMDAWLLANPAGQV